MPDKQFNVRAYTEKGIELRSSAIEDEHGAGFAAETYLRESSVVKVEIHKVIFEPEPEKIERKCDHWVTKKKPNIHKVKCGKPAKWEVEAWAVVYGVPTSGYFCDEHAKENGPGTFPKIGSRFKMIVKPLEENDP